jgi:hypothetical protein
MENTRNASPLQGVYLTREQIRTLAEWDHDVQIAVPKEDTGGFVDVRNRVPNDEIWVTRSRVLDAGGTVISDVMEENE